MPPLNLCTVLAKLDLSSLVPGLKILQNEQDYTHMKHFPLLFRFNDIVLGKGFLAGVTMRGRVLAVDEEDGDWWMFGVQPGDLAAGGTTFEEARAEFYEEFRAVLHDIAEEAPDTDTFRVEVENYFEGVNRPVEEEWLAAVSRFRAGGLSDLPSDKLSFEPADSPRGVDVEVISVPTPQQNVHDPQLALAA
jgi:predicted RNase H-like HicB family nuclease